MSRLEINFVNAIHLFSFLVYVDIGTVSTDTATLAFTFGTTTSTTRAWEIKVSQITCSNPNRYEKKYLGEQTGKLELVWYPEYFVSINVVILKKFKTFMCINIKKFEISFGSRTPKKPV